MATSRGLSDGGGLGGRRHRVVIVGAGLVACRRQALRRADVDMTVIDRTNHHLLQPRLYQMATGILAEGDMAPPVRTAPP